MKKQFAVARLRAGCLVVWDSKFVNVACFLVIVSNFVVYPGSQMHRPTENGVRSRSLVTRHSQKNECSEEHELERECKN